MTNEEAAQALVEACAKHGIVLKLRNESVTTDSIYLNFEDSDLRSVRVGDHNGKKKYRYKWNLRSDLKKRIVTQDQGAVRYFYPFSQIEEMAKHIKNYHQKIMASRDEPRHQV